MKDAIFFALLLLAILLLATGCSSNQYAVDCYNNQKLEYRKIQKYLFHTHNTEQYDECHVYRVKSAK